MDHIKGIQIALFEPPLNRQGPTWGKTPKGKKIQEFIRFTEAEDVDVVAASEDLRDEVAGLREAVEGEYE